MKIILNENNTHIISDEGYILFFKGQENDDDKYKFTECFIPGIAKESDFVEIKIEIPEEIDLNNIIEK